MIGAWSKACISPLIPSLPTKRELTSMRLYRCTSGSFGVIHLQIVQPTASPIQISWQDWMERFYSLPAVSTADITSTIQATYKPYAAAITAANNVVETSLPVEGNAPACVMRP